MIFKVSLSEAIIRCVVMASIFVLVLYILPANIRKLPRDDPRHVKARLVSVVVACILAPLVIWSAGSEAEASPPLLEWLGLTPKAPFLLGSGLPLLLTASLFLGPMAVSVADFYRLRFFFPDGVRPRATPIPINQAILLTSTCRFILDAPYSALRNYLVAPWAEEWVFRSCMVPLLFSAGVSTGWLIILAPSFFGIAHLHHVVEHVRGGLPIGRALLLGALQMSYTWLFGAFATFLLLRTGKHGAIFVSHAFCNLMGLPDLSFYFDIRHPQHPRRQVFLLIYCVGMLIFYHALLPLTEPRFYNVDSGNGSNSISALGTGGSLFWRSL